MGGPREEKWPRICSNSKHIKVFIVSGGGGGLDNRVAEETGHPSVSTILGYYPESGQEHVRLLSIKFRLNAER